jgi:hypothetical protein
VKAKRDADLLILPTDAAVFEDEGFRWAARPPDRCQLIAGRTARAAAVMPRLLRSALGIFVPGRGATGALLSGVGRACLMGDQAAF